MSVRIVERPQCLTRDECARVMAEFGPRLAKSTVSARDRARLVSPARTSSDYRLSPAELGDAGRTLDRIAVELTGRTLECREPWQLLRYEPGQFYRAHVDWFRRRWLPAERERGGQRTHSVIVYLCDVESGGVTRFPLLRRAVVPAAGKLVAWNNLDEKGRPLFAAKHEAASVENGEKWVLVTWFREHAWPGAAEERAPGALSAEQAS